MSLRLEGEKDGRNNCGRFNLYKYLFIQLYEQTLGAATWGSPISCVIANIFMEHFDKETLRKTTKKPEV